VFLMVENLNNLAKGGRLSKGEALVGNLLSIKPILIINKDGYIEPLEKVRTTNRALKHMNKLVDQQMKRFDSNAKIIFAHANCEKRALKQVRELQVTYTDTTYRVGFLTMIISAHVAEGALGAAVVPNVTHECEIKHKRPIFYCNMSITVDTLHYYLFHWVVFIFVYFYFLIKSMIKPILKTRVSDSTTNIVLQTPVIPK